MNDDAIIVLDPVNLPVIQNALAKGGKNWIGGNCTVSCMLMGVGALYKAGLVEWMTSMTYQAASGGGAQHMRELLTQFGTLNAEVRALLDDPKSAILEIDRKVLARQQSLSAAETANFGVPLGGRLIPWIDKDLGDGMQQGRVEGRRRDQQDPRPGRRASARPPRRSTASACASARCAATARR